MKRSEPIDNKYISLMEYREKLFREEIEKYILTLTGERESILPFVRDENGLYSETKTWDFIHELMEYISLYFAYETNDSNPDDLAELMLSAYDQEKEFFENFLYCAIRILETDCLCKICGINQTFQELILFSEEHYPTKIELYAAETLSDACYSSLAGSYVNLKGIYRPADWLTRLFTGNYASDLYTEQERAEYYPYLDPEIKEYKLTSEHIIPSEYYKHSEYFETDDALPFYEEAQWIKAHFIEQHQFVDRYLAFRNKKYNTIEFDVFVGGGIGQLVKGSVRLFLEKRGLSHIQDDNVFFTASALLRQANKRIQKAAIEDTRRV